MGIGTQVGRSDMTDEDRFVWIAGHLGNIDMFEVAGSNLVDASKLSRMPGMQYGACLWFMGEPALTFHGSTIREAVDAMIIHYERKK